MARYRSIQTMFWQDDFIIELPPEEKAFYVYLLTNTRTTQCGIYSFSLVMASVELSCSKEKIRALLQKFISYGKILFNETKSEVMILNWYKYNITSSRNTLLCINKELKDVKSRDFVKKLYELCQNTDYQLDVIFNGIEVPIYKKKDDSTAPVDSHADETENSAAVAAVDENAADYDTAEAAAAYRIREF